MGALTKIEWCDHTWNPWRGCKKVSAGCQNCYAERPSKRNPAVLGEWGDHGLRVIAKEPYWRLPIQWNAAAERDGERRRVFCLSLGDIFEVREELIEARSRVFDTIRRTPMLDWLLLTKRPQKFRRCLNQCIGHIDPNGVRSDDELEMLWIKDWYAGKPPANVWVGVSVENGDAAINRVPVLLSIPAHVRFLSVEPLLEEVHLSRALIGEIDWVIVGGESGPGARPCDVGWVRRVAADCVAHQVPVFVKQLGGNIRGLKDRNGLDHDKIADILGSRYRLKDPKGGVMEEWPADLRIRQFPVASE